MPRETKQSQEREYEGNTELEREREQREADSGQDGDDDDLDRRAEEARELDRNPMKHDEYQEDVEAEMDDLDLVDYQGPDA
ncbi:MAG TPA: hypothetical protein VL326_36805 [Kofleriaceae bacterium]|nr:hypothetical protein [Kofleriaceae bacterium]